MCSWPVEDLFTKFYMHFNLYAKYGKEANILLTMETLGSSKFVLELFGSNYAIDAFETNQHSQTKWKYSPNLAQIAKNLGLHHFEMIPYQKGYYHISKAIFYEVGKGELKILIYDGQKMYVEQNLEFLVLPRDTAECVPEVRLRHCANPQDPLKVDISRFNNIQLEVEKKCWDNSDMSYQWVVYDNFQTGKLQLTDDCNH